MPAPTQYPASTLQTPFKCTFEYPFYHLEDTLCIFHCKCGRQNGQWKMHCVSSTATVGERMSSEWCIMDIILQLRATIYVVGDAWCIFHCYCGRQNGQWKMHCAPSIATDGDNMGNGKRIVHLPLPLRATAWAVEDALCTVHCNCGRQHGQWKMHCASSTATAGDNMGPPNTM